MVSTPDSPIVDLVRSLAERRTEDYIEALVAIRDAATQLLEREDLDAPTAAEVHELFEPTPVDMLGLDIRISHALQRSGIFDTRKLLLCTEFDITDIRGLNKVSLAQIKERLAARGLRLSDS